MERGNIGNGRTLRHWGFSCLSGGGLTMRLNDPINIMQSCCIPDKRTLMEAISRLQPGEVLRVEIDNCVASKAMVESYLKNKWCRIEQIVEDERTSILHIRLDLKA